MNAQKLMTNVKNTLFSKYFAFKL